VKMVEGRTVLLELRAGSHLYGTNTPESDVDLRGVVLPLPEEIIGLGRFQQQEKHGDEDTLYYSLPRYIQLLLKGNPNVNEWINADIIDYTVWGVVGAELRDNRARFLSKKLGLSALGYLNGMTKKMHNGGPTRDLGAKRKALVERYGYDTKNASHAVRMAREIAELFETGVFNVKRTGDREELIAIRNGSLTLEQAEHLIAGETARAEESFEKNAAGLSDKPDEKWANQFLMRWQGEIILQFIERTAHAGAGAGASEEAR